MYKKFTIPRGMPKSYARKILLIMRLTTVILLASLMQVSAKTFAQKVTLKQNSITISQVFSELKKQTGYRVIYFSNKIDDKKIIKVNFNETPIEEVMNKILIGQPVTFTIQNKTIILKQEGKTFVDNLLDVFNNIDVHGRIVDESGNGLSGAVIKLKDGKKIAISDSNGYFTLNAVDENSTLIISYLGFQVKEIKVKKDLGEIKMQEMSGQLDSVDIVSTGYQNIPKERATGSFVQIDNGLINRSVSTNILDRLDGVTSGVVFNKNRPTDVPNNSAITIRGRATLFANANPLVILDNFAYDGDLNNINPNDIETITVLKDAAAASLWGARSGNGVIVITTKKGKLNQAPLVSFTANTTIGEKPDLYYSPQLTSSQFIEAEQFLFNKGAYNSNINNGYTPLTPAVEVFLAKRNGTISQADSLSRINTLKNYDYRDQYTKYFYRNSIKQQYQANVSGGGISQKYFVSAGYDKNLNSNVGNSYDRLTLNASNTYYFLNNQLELFSNIIYTGSITKSLPLTTTPYPYVQVADDNGSPLAVGRDFRLSNANSAGNGKLLNWQYKPLDEINNGYSTSTTNLTDYRINLSLGYSIIQGLKATAFYNYEKGVSDQSSLNEVESYYTRNLINKFYNPNPVTPLTIYPIPLGGILNSYNSSLQSHNGRFQIAYNNTWKKHSLDIIAGTEIRSYSSIDIYNQFYGYNLDTYSNQNAAVNYNISYPYFTGAGSERISNGSQKSGNNNRYLSNYINGAYTYAEKYILSVSARKDESNIFGVSTNQKGVPLWSSGVAWILNKEKFYGLNWLPQLKLRVTYGYTGNVSNTLSAYLTAQNTGGISDYGLPWTAIVNPPNPSLRWEKIRNINLGVDFSALSNRISGNIDLWQKKGLDLIGNSPIAPQTGVAIYTGNSANTLTKGLDLQLNTINLNGEVKWYTTILYNNSNSKVTEYKVSNGTNFNVVSANYNNPLQGYPYYSIFSFKYAGLDALGNPLGYLNGAVSNNYSGILNSTNREELKYNGSAVPTHFGSIRNTFAYSGFDFSFIVAYKLGYYFRRYSLKSTSVYNINGLTVNASADYDKRWQKPGDELTTNVPALLYPASTNRDNIYTYSDALVESADNLRLQDVRLGYTFTKSQWLPFRNLNLFMYLNNVGIVWRKNNYHLDPDYPAGIPTVRTIAFGIKADL